MKLTRGLETTVKAVSERLYIVGVYVYVLYIFLLELV